jgi:hypothetical protein
MRRQSEAPHAGVVLGLKHAFPQPLKAALILQHFRHG